MTDERSEISTIGPAAQTGRAEERTDGLYTCSEDCPEGELHGASGCEGCHNPDAPYIVAFPTWETAYCERCTRQLRSEGYRLSRRSKTLAADQMPLFT